MTTFIRFPASQLPKAVGRDDVDGRRKSDGRAGHLCHGPYITLGPGRYTAGFYLQRGAAEDEGDFSIEVCNEQGKNIFASRSSPVKDLFTSIAGLIHLDFTLDTVERGCELRLLVPAHAHVECSEAVLFRRDIANWGHR